MPLAIITGASRGLGLALARALGERHWALVIDARGAHELERTARELGAMTEVTAIPGDVADAAPIEETTAELSQVAEIAIRRVFQHWNDELRAKLPAGDQREFLRLWWQERLRAARRMFNDPAQVERIVSLLEAAEGGRRG